MQDMISRRRFALGACCGALVPAFGLDAALAADRLADDFARIERESGGRLGVAVADPQSKAQWTHRADERFPICSTFKLIAAAAVLARVDAGKEQLARRVRFEPRDVVVNSPVTKDHAGGAGMTLEELCTAAMTMSDNTAGNLLLASFGGPAGLTAWLRGLGDAQTRLDRIETALNEATPGDPRDTTTPAAMLADMQRLLLDDALSPRSREQLAAWLLASKTGAKRLRAGLPAQWRVGDKTGGGEHGTANDIAIAWPPGRAPILIAAYYTGSTLGEEARNQVIADAGRLAVKNLG